MQANHTYPQKHAQPCLTWVVHPAWQFGHLLDSLLDALNNIDYTAYGCATCLCSPGKHGDKGACQCLSLVECGEPLPTLYRYGFTYRNAHVLVAGSRRMLSLYKDDYFDDDFHSLLHPSFHWIEAADEAVKAARQKAEDVHGRLNNDESSGTVIGKNIKQIRDAKDKVQSVDDQLKNIHTDLGNWKSAASGVLGTALGKAKEVRDKLDPDGKDPIGTNIKSIEDANNSIVAANQTLDKQVQSLDAWITSAEEIRAAAEKKAKEAYDKLKVNKTLDKNVKLIVEANKAIEKVHKNLNGVHGSLGAWNKEAGKVLQGAIDRAKEVYNELDIETNGQSKTLKGKIEGIEKARTEIQSANSQLADELDNLGKWKSAAGSVIDMAEKKCDEILKRVDKQDPEGKIFTQAQELQKKGTTLLQAATEAKNKVGQYVNEALQAVVTMDQSLKMDLRTVREEIKKGISQVIDTLQVKTLDSFVKKDLKALREKIEGLKDGTLANSQLEALKQSAQKKSLDELAGDDDAKSIVRLTKGLDKKFKDSIQQPLNNKLQQVDQAIQTLGGKFSLSVDKQNVQGIFGYIKEKVGEIKGTPGQNGRGGKGVDGIVARFKAYVTGVGENMKKETGTDGTVHSWLDKILTHNGVVVYRLGKYFGENKGGQLNTYYTKPAQLHAPIRDQTKAKLKEAGVYDEAKGQHEIKNNGPLTDRLASLKEFLEKYASVLDGKINVDNNTFVTDLVSKIEGAVKNGISTNNQNLIPTVEAVLAALTADARRTAGEINSLLLSDNSGNVAKMIDNMQQIVNDLDTNLKAATDNSGQSAPPHGPNESPAQAVDSKLEEVKTEVKTLNDKFKTQVKQDLQNAVDELEPAVDTFNGVAVDQIKAAARTAIGKAAEQIGKDDNIVLGKTNKLMEKFEETFTPIKDSLKKNLDAQVERAPQIGIL
ncbi:Extracellular matrix-binding ebh [Babesia ovata]|uniref:Extracellular matrix-binding ebh n=1 Tax=Babesia ovata TaxID=189622 RepID=A0A2H6KFL6_9APIC|nr:Extracellular matrix-binding ebh [Babesia ovata]GBE61774.1 Extracellular matrix-binding ebh [Babesia ovata]